MRRELVSLLMPGFRMHTKWGTSAIQTSLIAFDLHNNPNGIYLRINPVRSPFVLRSFSVRESENERRTKGNVSTTHQY